MTREAAQTAVGAGEKIVVAVDARTLTQTGKGIPRFLIETLRELEKIPTLRLVLFSNRPLHPDNTVSADTVIDYRWRKVPGTIWMMARLNRLAISAGADILWGPAHVLPLRTRSLRSVLTVHDLVHRIMPKSMSNWNRWVSGALVDRSIRRADRIVADSESTKRDVISSVRATAKDIEVIYLGTRKTPGNLAVMSVSPNVNSRENYLFALGSIEPRKNIGGLLDCLELLREYLPGISLTLTGAHHWKSADILGRINSCGFCTTVGFLSDRDINKYMTRSRAFIMPSHYEGFGLPIIEAVSLAPIIASDIPVFRELGAFIDGICFINFSEPQAAAEQISAFLSSNPAPARFKPGAEEIFSWNGVAKRYAAVFTSI